ncbi:MAG TPA: MarR family transcriptional regulator [Streptosporangiaceae bacterium]
MSSSIDDAELVGLLAQLLRVVNPAAMAGAAGSLAQAVASPAAAAEAVNSRGADAVNSRGAEAVNSRGADAVTAVDGMPDAPVPVVSASEARALIELVAARGIAQGQLATLLGLEKSTVSRLASGLERKGWIRRGRDEENQRYIRLYLTPEGRLIAARVWRTWQSRQARIIASLSAEERAGLSAGLRGLVRGLAAEGLLGDLPPAADAVQHGT